MVMRVSVGRIIYGDGPNRGVIGPGERFDTDLLGWDANEVRNRERLGVLRRPRDDAVMAAQPAPGPGTAVEEGRSGPVGDARSPAAFETDQPQGDADTAAAPRGRLRQADDLGL